MLMGGGCEIRDCPGIFKEPTLLVGSDSAFSVWYHNQDLRGDTLTAEWQYNRNLYDSAYLLELPMDMNDTAMSYNFMVNKVDRGELIYTYTISTIYCSGYKAEKYVQVFSDIGIDSTSTFLNLYGDYGSGPRIDSLLNTTVRGYYSSSSIWWVVF
jgi:hypothetical protein